MQRDSAPEADCCKATEKSKTSIFKWEKSEVSWYKCCGKDNLSAVRVCVFGYECDFAQDVLVCVRLVIPGHPCTKQPLLDLVFVSVILRSILVCDTPMLPPGGDS